VPTAMILMAHTALLHRTAGSLTEAGAHASRNALLELARGLILDRFDDQESAFTPALAQAARDLADARLTDPELTTASVAGQLHVSVRTLQRAFAGLDESLNAYIRRRRLERAAGALVADRSPLTVSQAAAVWRFTDSSHFIRSFKRQFHVTPAEFARRNKS
jgi:AraC-like DNA-binding protein